MNRGVFDVNIRLQILHDLDLKFPITSKRYRNLHKVEKDELFQVLKEMRGEGLIGLSGEENEHFTEINLENILISRDGKELLHSSCSNA